MSLKNIDINVAEFYVLGSFHVEMSISTEDRYVNYNRTSGASMAMT